MSDENTNTENAITEEEQPKRKKQQRQKIFGVIINGEDSEIRTFKTKTELNEFINDECKKPNGVEISQGRFRLEEGGVFTPIIGRTVMQKRSYQ